MSLRLSFRKILPSAKNKSPGKSPKTPPEKPLSRFNRDSTTGTPEKDLCPAVEDSTLDINHIDGTLIFIHILFAIPFLAVRYTSRRFNVVGSQITSERLLVTAVLA